MPVPHGVQAVYTVVGQALPPVFACLRSFCHRLLGIDKTFTACPLLPALRVRIVTAEVRRPQCPNRAKLSFFSHPMREKFWGRRSDSSVWQVRSAPLATSRALSTARWIAITGAP